MLRQLLTIGIACGLLSVGVTPLAAQSGDCDPEPAMAMISRAPDGTPGNSRSYYPVISGDGRYVAFASYADNLVPDDTNEAQDVFIYDRLTCQLNRVMAADGSEANDSTWPLSLSDDGRYLLLMSNATNFDLAFIPPSGGNPGLFLFDTQEQTFTYIALSVGLIPDMSGDGRYVVYPSLEAGVPDDTDEVMNLYLYDRINHAISRITANGPDEPGPYANTVYYLPGISGDGAYIAFATDANNLVETDTNYMYDIFLLERGVNALTQITPIEERERGDDATHGSPFAPVLTADGRYTVFSSFSPNIVPDDEDCFPIYTYDRITQITDCIKAAPENENRLFPHGTWSIDVSGDGRYISFNAGEAYVYDHYTQRLQIISMTTDGQPGFIGYDRPVISHDGRFVAFDSDSAVLTNDSGVNSQVFLTDWQRLTDYVSAIFPQRNVFPTATPTLTWSAVTWAAAYEIQIDDTDDFSSPVYHSTTLTAPEVITPELPSGVYYWRVRAQRPNGTWSEWSVVDSFVVDVP